MPRSSRRMARRVSAPPPGRFHTRMHTPRDVSSGRLDSWDSPLLTVIVGLYPRWCWMWIKFDEPKVISSCPKRHRQNVQRLRAKVKSLSHQHHLTTACAAIVSSQNGPTFSHRQYVPLFLLVHSKTSCCSNNKQLFHDGGKQQYTSKVKSAKACRIRLHTSATG